MANEIYASERKADQPFVTDRLPPIVHRAISDLYTRHGLTWVEIEALSAEPFGQRWDDEIEEDEDGNVSTITPAFEVHPGRGFVPWDNLPPKVLGLFPNRRIAKSSLQRWYKVRVKQVRQQMLLASERAREVAQAFAAATVEGSNDAVLNAARDQLMVALSEDASADGRRATAKALVGLASVMQVARANDIKERKVSVDEQVLQMKLDEIKRKAQQLLDDVTGESGEVQQRMTPEQLAERIRETYGLTG